jgi:hypothetical protein
MAGLNGCDSLRPASRCPLVALRLTTGVDVRTPERPERFGRMGEKPQGITCEARARQLLSRSVVRSV